MSTPPGDPLLARFAWHDLPPALQPVAVTYAARAIEVAAGPTRATELRALLAARDAALWAADQTR